MLILLKCIFDAVNKFASWTRWCHCISLINSTINTSASQTHWYWTSPRCPLSVCSQELFLHFFQLTNNFLLDFYTFSFWDPCFYSTYFLFFCLLFSFVFYIFFFKHTVHWKYNLWNYKYYSPGSQIILKPLPFAYSENI